MGMEIERKFVVNEKWSAPGRGIPIKQGYLSTNPDKAVRIRTAGGNAFLTLKKQISDLSRHEYEFPIPVHEAEEILQTICKKPVIEKMRYQVNFQGFTWEIDVFSGENEGLVIAEIELDSEGQEFARPDWLGEEVTGDPRYLNLNLVENPYHKWKAGT